MAWIKLHTDILDDVQKTRKLTADSYQIFTFLLLYAKELESNGEVNLPLEDIQWRLRVDMEILKKGIADLKDCEILSKKHSGIKFTNWTKRQLSESYERVKKHRMKRYSNGESNDDETSCNKGVTDTRSREKKREEKKREEKDNKKTLLESDESSRSLSKWFDEVMWPSVPKKVGKDLTWIAVKNLKPDEETRKKIVRYFTEYPKVKATYDAAGEFMAEMQDPVRVIKHRRFEDVLTPFRGQSRGGGMAQPSGSNGQMPKLNLHLWSEERIRQKLRLEGESFRKAMLEEGLDPALYEEN